MSDLQTSQLWQSLRQLTQARVATGRSGDTLPTSAILEFETALAQARDAVHQLLETSLLITAIAKLGLTSLEVHSSAPDRATYLRRPDLGRRLSETSRALIERAQHPGLTIVIADGLSAAAPAAHAVPLLNELMHDQAILPTQPILLATQARVALGDEIGELRGAEAVLVLIGERPGLTTPASLGAYLTWNPRFGRTDAERNCISNIHPGGLSYTAAAHKISTLVRNARKLGATGVTLHDEDESKGSDPRAALP